jgi:RNA polymerase sigma-70 factor, ECF subfamily
MLVVPTASMVPGRSKIPDPSRTSAISRVGAPGDTMGAMTADDLTLLAQAAAQGDDRALNELVLATQAKVHRLCSHLGSLADADDLAQETYLRALRALPTYRSEAPVIVWLLSIARHVCADHVRRRVRRAEIDQRFPTRSAPTEPDHRIVIDDLVARLDPDQASAFILTQELGLSYEEAAAICDCPIGTIRSRVARARATLVAQVRAAEAG